MGIDLFHIITSRKAKLQKVPHYSFIQPAREAVTGRRCPHSGVGEDFLVRLPVFFTKRAVSRKPKVEKSIRRYQIDRLGEVYKWTIEKIQGLIEKNGFSGQKPNFWTQKKGITS